MKISVGGWWTFLAGLLAVVARFGGGTAFDELMPSSTEPATVMLPPPIQEIATKDRRQTGPYFDSQTPLNVTAQQGKTAYLHCQVRHLGNKTVSWVRHRDLHILTVARYTYVSDQRFQAYHLADTDDWTLQIRYTQPRDAGIYECQVSTVPKMSLIITLNVVVPKSVIQGGPEMFMKTGSTITLQCVIAESPEPPVFIFWYHEDKVLNYDTSRRSIRVEPVNADTTISKLLITNAQPSDSGNYTCTPSNSDPTSIIVHVLNGEKPAAMQHGKHSAGSHRIPEEGVMVLSVALAAILVACDWALVL